MRFPVFMPCWAVTIFLALMACTATDGVSTKDANTGADTKGPANSNPNGAATCGLFVNGNTTPVSAAVGDVLNYSTDFAWDSNLYKTAWYGTRNGAMDMVDVENSVTAYNGPLFLEAAGNSYTRWLLVTNRNTRAVVCDSRTSGGTQKGALMIGVRNLEVSAKSIDQVRGRNYYLLDSNFECNRPDGSRVKTYRESISFVAGSGVSRRLGCATTATTAEFTSAYQFTATLNFLQISGQTYTYLATEPAPVRVAKLKKPTENGARDRKPASQK